MPLDGAAACGEDMIQALGSDLEDAALQNMSPIVWWEVTQCWTVDQAIDHLGTLCCLEQGGVIIPNWYGCDLRIAKRRKV